MDGAGDNPVSRSADTFRITRRAFIGSAGAGAVVAGTSAWGNEDECLHDQRLTYEWADNAETGDRLLEIHLITRKHLEPDAGESQASVETRAAATEERSGISWQLDLRAFGPDARVVLFRSATPGLRDRLVIQNVGYGRLAGRRITFVFSRRETLLDCGVRRRIVLEMETTVWSSKAGATSKSEFSLEAENVRPRKWILFRDFVGSAQGQIGPRRFVQTIPAIRVANTAKLMFNGLITVVPGSDDRLVEVFFDKSLIWVIDARQRLAALSGRVRLTELELFWTREDSNSPSQEREAMLFGQATLRPDAANGLRIGGGGGPTLSFTGVEVTNQPLLVLFRAGGADPDRVEAGRIRGEAVLAGRWKGASFLGGEGIGEVGPLPDLEGSVLERIDARGPITETSLNTPPGSISFQARYVANSLATNAQSPVGPLSLSGLADRDDDEPVAGKFPSRRGWPVTALWSWTPTKGRRQMPAADFVEAGVALVEAGIALPGAAWSRLTFAGTELRIHYTSERLGAPPIGSHLDLGATNQVGLAVLDLARARLRASQSDQLLALSFRFSDLSLRIDGAELTLVGSTPECSLAARPRSAQEDLTNTDRGPAFADQVSQDRRPVLVVEFPPQHLFEEASFRPGRSALPDVVLNTGMIIDRKTGAVEFPKDKPTTYKIDANTIELDPDRRSHVVDALDVLARSGKPALLRNVRMHLLKEKAKLLPETAKEKPDITEEEKKKNQAENFRRKAFADFARKVARLRRGLSNVTSDQRIYIGPFAMDVDFMARVRRLFDLGAIARARAVIDDMFAAIRQERQRMGLSYPVGADLDAALKVEVQLQAVVPLYQQFRTFYRDQLLASFSRPGSTSLPAGFEATSEAPGEVEYIDFASDHPLSSDLRRKRLEVIRKAFIADLQGAEALEGPKRGRLANHSRLAFRVNCLDVLEAAQAAQAAQLDGPEDAEVRLPRRALHFDLNELLQFRGMELAVTARAEIPYEPDAHGRIGGRAVRLSDISPGAMMARLGFTRGPNTSVAIRLAEIAASLRAPTAFETAIEMPARVTLSPHQNAVVLTPQQPEGMAQVFDLALGACSATTGPATGAVVRRLWAARFVTGQDGLDLDPGLRAVHSPDLRPGALLTRFAEREKDVLPMTQPPGGPLDPWFLSGTQSEATPPTLQELNALFSGHDDVCEAAANPAVRDLPGILRAFCHRVGLIRSKRRITFRNGLDARDRHQLVMLSSAWGLPIKYAAQGDTKPTAQPEPEWQLWDVLPGNGIYAPRSLDVTELTLTTLGGVLRHDTGFEPPTAPLFWRSRDGVYDAFSVERWQHWINLGRDIFTEVVYKGFLLPLGIRASLVKVTEREFWIDPKTGAITAPLRQRMFIRVARPEKLFPAVRQPSNGRCFPIRRLELLTTVTPDIVDPYSEAAQNEQSEELPSGRLLLKGARGLVFWPRTLKARQGDIRFEMTVDGIRSDLPLIFADQTAINDQVTMNALVAYYARLASPAEGMSVEPINHRRTLQLRGAAMRYAPEVKAGSASFQTEHWTLHATGGANAALPTVDNPAAESGTLGTIAMHNDDFNFDAVRQANDQPPIYPAIASARMYLTQTERLIGRRLGAVDTYFDGAFVRDGLGETEQKENSAEVVLVLAKGVALKMGDKGDQSGGIFRPAGHVVGLSRAKGALTLDNAPTVPPVAGMNYTLPLMSPLFDERKIREAASAAEMRFGGKASERKPSGTELEELRKYYQSLLSSDAKICGLVSVKELIGLCQGLGYPIDDAPALTEALEFGAAGKAGAEQIRKEIIIPLAAAIRSVREEWAALEQRINDELARGIGAGNAGQDADKKVTGFEIRKVFPELYQSLADLEAALVQAESETDPVLFGFELGACYSAGMRFLGALERAASNPGQALEALVSQTFAGLLALVDALRGGLKKYFDPLFENLIGDLDAAISEVIEDGFKQGAPFIRRAFLSFPQPYIGSATAPDKWQHCLEGFVPGADDAEAVLTAFVKHALLAIAKGGRLDAMTLINDWLDDSDAKIEFSLRFGDSLKELRQRLNAGIKALADAAEASIEADSASEALSVELDAAVGKLKKALDEIFFLPVGDADDFIASGPPREQICKRYISGVLVAMAEADMTDCITGLPLGYPRGVVAELTF